jgi:hypothetical protein
MTPVFLTGGRRVVDARDPAFGDARASATLAFIRGTSCASARRADRRGTRARMPAGRVAKVRDSRRFPIASGDVASLPWS